MFNRHSKEFAAQLKWMVIATYPYKNINTIKEGSTVKKLYKSNSDVMIEGVCGGLAEYFDIDSTVIRIIWAFMIATGSGLLLYIIMAVLLPKRPKGSF